MTGIMGWLIEGGNQGTFRARRLLVWDDPVVFWGGAPDNSNPALGPVADPLHGDSSDRVAEGSS